MARLTLRALLNYGTFNVQCGKAHVASLAKLRNVERRNVARLTLRNLAQGSHWCAHIASLAKLRNVEHCNVSAPPRSATASAARYFKPTRTRPNKTTIAHLDEAKDDDPEARHTRAGVAHSQRSAEVCACILPRGWIVCAQLRNQLGVDEVQAPSRLAPAVLAGCTHSRRAE